MNCACGYKNPENPCRQGFSGFLPAWLIVRLYLSGCLLIVPDKVDVHRRQNNDTFYDILPVGVDAHQVQAVVQDADNQDTDQGTAQSSRAAGHGGAADHDSRDGVRS